MKKAFSILLAIVLSVSFVVISRSSVAEASEVSVDGDYHVILIGTIDVSLEFSGVEVCTIERGNVTWKNNDYIRELGLDHGGGGAITVPEGVDIRFVLPLKESVAFSIKVKAYDTGSFNYTIEYLPNGNRPPQFILGPEVVSIDAGTTREIKVGGGQASFVGETTNTSSNVTDTPGVLNAPGAQLESSTPLYLAIGLGVLILVALVVGIVLLNVFFSKRRQ